MAKTTEANTGEVDVGLRINPKRLRYALDLYKLTNESFLSLLNKDRKKGLTPDDLDRIFKGERAVDVPLLKRIDKLLGKGLHWYISNRDLPERPSSSIFFRKDSFNAELNLESIRVANSFEGRKFEIQTLCKYIDYQPKRKLKHYGTDDDPRKIAQEIKREFEEAKKNFRGSIKEPDPEKAYLRNLIRLIEEFNVYVFEYVEAWNKKVKVNYNGLYMSPALIVVKRQKVYRREIFTLLHEFAHHLLDREEIDEASDSFVDGNQIEKWCNDFVYYYLAGDYDEKIEALPYATKENAYNEKEVQEIRKNTFLSTSAIYTRLRIINKISHGDYDQRIRAINEAINADIAKRKAEREMKGEKGGGAPKPIQSHLFKELVRINYFQGNIDDARACELLNINPRKLEQELY